MRNSKYIDSVLSHIKNKGSHREIQEELYDHIDEKDRFFEKIGYDSVSAQEKTEEAMGDGDIVGEQLDMQTGNRAKSVVYIIIAVLGAVAGIALFFSYISTCEEHFYIYTKFWDFVISFIIFEICFVNLFIGIRRKKFLNLMSGALFILYPLGLFAVNADNFAEYISEGKNPIEYFYSTAESSQAIDITAIILIIIAVSFVTGLVNIAKTLILKNSKFDLYAKKTATAAVALVMATSAVFTGYIAFSVNLQRENIIDTATQELQNADERFINNIDMFITDDDGKFKSALESTFDEGTYSYNSNKNESEIFVKANKIKIKSSIYIERKVTDPYAKYETNYINNLSKISDFKINSETKITDIPQPSEIFFEYSGDNCFFTFYFIPDNYNDWVYTSITNDYIMFIYDFDKKEFVPADSSLYDYSLSADITQKQRKNAESCIAKQENIFEREHNFVKIYDITQCEESAIKNVYKVDCGYCFCDNPDEMQFYDYDENRDMSYIMLITDNDAIIIRTFTDYNSPAEVFSKKAFMEYKNDKTDWVAQALKESG